MPVDDIPDGILVDNVKSTQAPYFASSALTRANETGDEIFGEGNH